MDSLTLEFINNATEFIAGAKTYTEAIVNHTAIQQRVTAEGTTGEVTAERYNAGRQALEQIRHHVTHEPRAISLAEYWDLLNRHDWHNAQSDDHTVWERGRAYAAWLLEIANLNGQPAIDLRKAWYAHTFSGKPWGTDKQPLPARPAEYRYRLYHTGGSTEKYGPCEICHKYVTDIWHMVEELHSGNSWTALACLNLFGHKECLLSKRKP